MIIDKIGDALLALEKGEINILAHGVNCSGGFGSGIAGQIAKKYPMVKQAFHNRDFKLGEVQLVQVGLNRYIANCATQQLYGGNPKSQPSGMYCDYNAIQECMTTLSMMITTDSMKSTIDLISYPPVIGVNWIGAGLAGGEWKYIRGAIIGNAFKDGKDIRCYRYSITPMEVETVKSVIDFVNPSKDHDGFLGDNDRWSNLKILFSTTPHVYFGTINDEDYFSVCKVKFYKHTKIKDFLEELQSVYNNNMSQ